jgi:hypothetical protein
MPYWKPEFGQHTAFVGTSSAPEFPAWLIGLPTTRKSTGDSANGRARQLPISRCDSVPLKSGCENNSPSDFVYPRVRLCLILILAFASLCGDAAAQNVAIADATVYHAQGATARTHTTILIHAGKIAGIGSKLRIPSGVRVLPCDGCIVFAGFWNTHVHFTGPQWDKSDRVPAGQLSRDMQSMLTHSGFTTVVDLSSDPINTTGLRRRVESGEVAGPRIYTVGLDYTRLMESRSIWMTSR